ncbi:hypothetical protein CDD82_5283 [Ophiocordyceps australis]|uniref:Uncharacterized protein n=1 Tax=Ophiocordyceps australis TaxID=1399860 RepID=A0A2C5ZNJ5_9HYPO|nr:hypothetical protein CDD82_5283 [Ophiocordyceps australis]
MYMHDLATASALRLRSTGVLGKTAKKRKRKRGQKRMCIASPAPALGAFFPTPIPASCPSTATANPSVYRSTPTTPALHCQRSATSALQRTISAPYSTASALQKTISAPYSTASALQSHIQDAIFLHRRHKPSVQNTLSRLVFFFFFFFFPTPPDRPRQPAHAERQDP